MKLTFRMIEPCEYDEAHALWNECFPGDVNGFSDYYFSRRTDYKKILAAFREDGKMVSDLHMLPYPLDFFGQRRECCMVAGVATAHAYRKRGIAGALLTAADDIMRENGFCAALLQPFETHFYEGVGYVPFGSVERFSVTAADFLGISAAELHAPTPAELLRIYDAFRRPYIGMMLRDEKYMAELLCEYASTGGSVAATDDAYAAYSAEDGLATVFECAGEGEAMLRLIASLCRENVRVEFLAPRGAIKGLSNGRPDVFNMIKPLTNALFDGLPVDGIDVLMVAYGDRTMALEYY